MLNYQEVYEKVEEALNDDITYKLAEAFTETTDGEKVKQILAEEFEQAIHDVDNFDLSVDEYLLLRLEQQEKSHEAGYYDSTEEAETEGFYWFDELELWIKLPYNV